MLRSPLQPVLRSPISLVTDAIRRAFPWPSLFTNNIPGFRVNVEEALRLNKAAIGSKTSGFTPEELSRCVAFQDSAGTLPVTAMEQPLGLILDTKAGVPVLGSQLVTNGGFDTDTAWTKGTGWAIGSGVATKTAGTASTLTPSTAIVPTVGRWYVVEYTITRTDGSLTVSIGAGTGAAKTASGTYREILCASTTDNLTFSADATFAGTVDSVSVRELPGNHFVQPSNTASRPIVSRRVNLLRETEDFSGAYWNKVRAAVTEKTRVTATESSANGFNVSRGSLAIPAASPLQAIFRLERGSHDWAIVTVFDGSANGVRQWVNTATGQLGTTNTFGSGWSRGAASASVDGADVVLTIQVNTVGTTAGVVIQPATSGNGAFSCVLGDYGFVKQVDLRLSIDSALPYQRVTSSTDYDESGFPAYARFDGLDDWLETGGTVDMTSTDAVTVIAGVTKLSDAEAGIVIESSVNATSNAGAIALYAPDAAAATYEYTSRGTASSDATASGQAAPRKSLLSGVSKISTDTAVLRINGVQAATSATDQGTGNYTAQKFYMGRRGGASLPFNGRIYGVTVVGKLLTDSQLARAEQAERQLGRLY